MATARNDVGTKPTARPGLPLSDAEAELLQRARLAFGRRGDTTPAGAMPEPGSDADHDTDPAPTGGVPGEGGTSTGGVPGEGGTDTAAPGADTEAATDTATDTGGTRAPAPASGPDVGAILRDALEAGDDLVGVFEWPGGAIRWANAALSARYPAGSGSAERTFVGLLDEWSQAQFLVRALPELLRDGRWRGRLGFESGPATGGAFDAVLVTHRQGGGPVHALSLVARPLPSRSAGEGAPSGAGTEQILAALVQHGSDLIIVVDVDGEVLFASPAAEALLDLSSAGERNLFELLDPADRPATVRDLAQGPAGEGAEAGGAPVRLRVRGRDGAWRRLSAVVTDLVDHPGVGGLVINARDVTDESDALLSLVARGYTDELTGLPNRVRLRDELGALRAERPSRPLAFLLVDLDRFRQVNEQHGPAFTDKVLRILAHRLVDAAPAHAVVARLRSDEFAVVVPDLEGVDAVTALADGLRSALRSPVFVADASIAVTATVGIALTEEGTDDDEMLAHADQAVRRAKAAGGDRTAVHDSEAVRRDARRRELDRQLRRALDDDGLRLRYQPVVDLRTGAVVAAEALLRVQVDGGELRSPLEFIEAAETGGLITRLGHAVLDATCGELVRASGTAEAHGALDLFVNVSPRQLSDPSFTSRTLEIVDASGLAPERLWIEITEGAFLGHDDASESNILGLRDRGVRIGLDEFGGNTSLGYLRRFPLDFVKIDRSLVSGLGGNYVDSAIVRAVIELAQKLNLLTVAVGVETEVQRQRLVEMGCDRAQGYLFGGPAPLDALDATR